MAKLKKPREVMGTELINGTERRIVMVRYVPTEAGVEQYIEASGEYVLRAMIPGEAWDEWIASEDTAGRAQKADDEDTPPPAPAPAPPVT